MVTSKFSLCSNTEVFRPSLFCGVFKALFPIQINKLLSGESSDHLCATSMLFSGLCSFWKAPCIINTLIHQAPGNRKWLTADNHRNALSSYSLSKVYAMVLLLMWLPPHSHYHITSLPGLPISAHYFHSSIIFSVPAPSLQVQTNCSVESSHSLQHSAPWCSRISM